ncbi:hypothetical protein ABVB69_38790 [Streptomyces sp. NPDC000349]|uniref:hypothetical protein n=1 Tax=Streptomyces sp. NPDC000349 TaxID=3154249 RepID=UPI00336A24A2
MHTTLLPGALSSPGTVVFQDPQNRQFAYTPGGENSGQATVSVNDGKGNWVSLDMKADLKRLGEFIQKNRSPITTAIKFLGFSLVAAGAVVKDRGAPATGASLQDAGNYVNNATAASDIAHYLHSAIQTIRKDGLTWWVVKDLTKAVVQTASLGAGVASVALSEETLTQAAAPITAAAAAVATGQTGQEAKEETRKSVMGQYPDAFLGQGDLQQGPSIPLGGRTDSNTVSLISEPPSGNMSRAATLHSTSSQPIPGQLARRPTSVRPLGTTHEVDETRNPSSPTNPISSAYNLADIPAQSEGTSKTLAHSGNPSGLETRSEPRISRKR